MTGIIIVIAVIAVEIVLSAKWIRPYFTAGLPVFMRRVERSGGIDDVSLDELARSSKTAAASPLAFQPLRPGAIAFREGVLGQYLPVMRGIIRSDPAEASVRVIGLLNWYVLATAAVLVATLGRGVVVILPAFLGAFGILYFVQAVRFNRVAKQLRR